jgi:hypothetical protein
MTVPMIPPIWDFTIIGIVMDDVVFLVECKCHHRSVPEEEVAR